MTQTDRWTDAVIDNREPMDPNPTQVLPKINRLANIRAVIFDIYGTLVISGSGDVGSADPAGQDSRIVDSIAAVGFRSESMPNAADLVRKIQQLNEDRRSDTCHYPEVDVVEAWRQILREHQIELATNQVVELAAEYESRANPTWPMPGARELLSRLKGSGLSLGIVSNAQVFTIPLVKDLTVQRGLAAAGFDLDLCVFSNRYRHAKPGPRLFDVLRTGLAKRGIKPAEAIYVGNDMLNDVWAASQAGLRTAWFAGDKRSCRARRTIPDVGRCGPIWF